MPSKADILTTQAHPDFAELLIAIFSGLTLALIAIFVCASPLTNQISGTRDFVAYWATGQQLVHHANPYDTDAMKRIEHGAGLSAGYTVGFMRNPPWGLPLALPLGFVSLLVGTFLWSLAQLAILLGSSYMLWRLHGSRKDHTHWLGFSFAPAVLCLMMGQTSLFVLLGLVLFLRLHRTFPFLAGMSLWLCALKPHLFLPFGVVLFVWVIVTKSYRILAGAAIAMTASLALVYWVDPLAWAQYFDMIRGCGIEHEFIPCLSIVLRLWVSPKAMWLQYLPTALGCIWALVYYWTRRNSWDWMKEGSLLMLVSIFVAPYCWLFDQGLAIPALLEGAYQTRSRIWLAVLVFASVLLNIELFGGVGLPSMLYFWAAPGWLAWYLIATGIMGARTQQIPAHTTVAE
jgi:hypothetical protein